MVYERWLRYVTLYDGWVSATATPVRTAPIVDFRRRAVDTLASDAAATLLVRVVSVNRHRRKETDRTSGLRLHRSLNQAVQPQKMCVIKCCNKNICGTKCVDVDYEIKC